MYKVVVPIHDANIKPHFLNTIHYSQSDFITYLNIFGFNLTI